MKNFLAAIGLVLATLGGADAAEFNEAWHDENTSIVLDAYEYTPLQWSKMHDNERLAGFINKASDGLAPTYRCGRNPLCRVKWRRYSATQELYHTRKVLAKKLGMKWGAYHLGRPGNPREQAQHFVNFTKPDKDDLLAIDIEHNDPTKWMSLSDAEIFSQAVREMTGRYPVLYTNHSTAKFIAANRDRYPLLSRLNLWYARYKKDLGNAFPMGNWDSYTIWQFSSMVNCNDRSCPWRIKGAGNWIDVNVVAMSPEKLKREWPFARLRAPKRPMPVVASDAAPVKQAAYVPAPNAAVEAAARRSGITIPKWKPEASKVVASAARSAPVSPQPVSRAEQAEAVIDAATTATVDKPSKANSIVSLRRPAHGLDVIAHRQAELEGRKTTPYMPGKLFPAEDLMMRRISQVEAFDSQS